MPNDMHQAIIPKSDQLNADDLIGREMTIKITGVTVRGGQEQPVSIHFEGDNGKPYKACKSMCRVMVTAWGPDSSKYVGRSMTLYRDPKVKWGGMEVGGIRISHMSHLEDDMTMALTATKGSRKPYTVRPLVADAAPKSDASPVITAAQHKRLEARISEVGIDRDKVKKYVKKTFGLDHFTEMNKEQYDTIDQMLTDYVPKGKAATAPATIGDRIAACKTVAELDALSDTLSEDDAGIYFDAVAARKAQLQESWL